MISWIQNHLIRHGRWIFLSLLALIIVAFVFTIGNTPGCTNKQDAYQERSFYGIDLNSVREREAISDKAQMSAFLNGQQIRTESQFQSLIMKRIAMLHLADELGVPAPSKEAMTDYVKTKRAFIGADGEFSADTYTQFVDVVDTNPNMRTEVISLVLEEDYRIDQLSDVVTGPGYMLPSEAVAEAQSNLTTLKLATAEIAYADFNPEIVIGDADLQSYFEANSAAYTIPERIEASYVVFPGSRYADQVVEATDAELREHFITNRAQFAAVFEAAQPKPAEGEETPAMTFEDVREAVSKSFVEAAATRIANEAAQTFAYELYDKQIQRDSTAFNQLVNEYKLTLIPIEPFTAKGAAQRALSVELLESAFSLNDNRYYSDAYPIDGAYAVLIYQGRIDPELPELESIKAEVTENYQTDTRLELFEAEGERLKTELEAMLTAGTGFADAAAGLNLGVNEFEAFIVREAPRELSPSLLKSALSMKAGSVSPMTTANEIGSFVYLESKEVPEIAEDDESLEQSKQFLTYLSASASNNDLLNELVSLGVTEEDRNVPE